MTKAHQLRNKAETAKQTSEMFKDKKFIAHWQMKKSGNSSEESSMTTNG